MPHLHGDPIYCMSANQERVHKAYGSIPIWLDSTGAFQCTFCNSGDEGCSDSCLMATVMNKMRADVRFLDAEEHRKGIPVTYEEMEHRFHKFCHSQHVQVLVSGDRLYSDFVSKHKILLLLQGLSHWLKREADRYADAGGVHNQSKDRLALKCDKAVSQFLRLDLDSMTEEDTIILCNAIETSGYYALDRATQNSIQCILDLLSVVNAVKETQRANDASLEQMQDEQEQEKLLPPQMLGPSPVDSSCDIMGFMDPCFPTSPPSIATPKLPSVRTPPSAAPKPIVSPRVVLPKTREPKPTFSKLSRSNSKQVEEEEFVDDPLAPNRCRGRTKAGVRCKLTEESVGKLHGRCAEAAEPLARGAKYCKFHCDQEPLF